MSPQQRHTGEDKAILAVRQALYIRDQQRDLGRWPGKTRDWSHMGAVTLNLEREAVVNMASDAQHSQQITA